MGKDLRNHLAYLEMNLPTELVRIKKEVDPAWEVAALIRRLQAEEKFPALIFEQVKGHRMPIVSNLFATRQRLAAALETDAQTTLAEYVKREQNLILPVLVNSGPVKEVIKKGKDADLTQLPIVTHSEKDAGPFITAGIGTVKDPDTGISNSGIYRMQLKGPRKLGIGVGPESHLAHIYKKYERKGEPMPIAITVGHHPAVYHGSQSRCPLEVGEYAVMGGLLNEPLELVKAETVDLEVPAYAEVVIEGLIPPGVREGEGPFGEFTWYYGPEHQNPIIEVTAICHRHDAIFHDIYTPYLDHNLCGVLGREAGLFKRIKEVIPTITNVVMPDWGGGRFSCIIQMVKEYDGQGKNALLAAMAADPYIKIAIAVDDDVEITSDREVLWAITTRTQPDRDLFFVPEAFLCRLTPTGYTVRSRSEKGDMDTKLAIDATKPLGLPFPERCDVKRQLWQNLNLANYLYVG